MEEINCIFCDNSNTTIVIRENGWTGQKCLNCGLIFVSPRPSSDEVKALYAHDQARIPAEGHISANLFKNLHARHSLRLIKKYRKSGTLLEIGAGGGHFLTTAKNAGFDVFGIEINPIQANFIRNRLDIECEESALAPSSFRSKSFDIIYHCDVISHFYDPFAEFTKMNNKLSDNGIVVFETGNWGDVNEKYYSSEKVYQFPDHLFFFSGENLRDLLQRTGFEILDVYRYSIQFDQAVSESINWIKAVVKPSKKASGKAKSNFEPAAPSGSILKNLVRDARNLLAFIAVYQIGSVLPKKHRPQTVIVVARKRDHISVYR